LQKSKRKAEKELKKAGGKSPAAKKSPLAKEVKKSPAAKKAEKPKAKPGNKKATPAKSPASRKRASPVEKEETCKVCHAVLAKTAPSEVARHMNSRACRSAAAELKKAAGKGDAASADDEIDPLDVDANGVDDVVGDIVARTCQYCGKVVDDVKDLPGHYSTKGCIAKKYQNMQNGDAKGLTSSDTPVVIENAEDDSEQIVPNDLDSDNRLEQRSVS
jgi:hypothetical protein